MGLLAEIQNDAISDKVPVATLLRKVLVLASNLDSDVLEEWVRFEMNGYPRQAEVPQYRRIKMNFKVTGGNMAYQVTNAPLASAAVMVATGDNDISILKYRQAIGSIDVDEIKKAESLSVDMMNYAHFLPGKVTERSYSIHAFWGEIPASEILGIVEAVRNRVLDFVLSLKKRYPNAGEIDAISAKEASVEKVVTQIFNTTVQGNAGVIGTANNSTVNITANSGNLQDLRNQLTQYGVNDDDLDELAVALNEEPQISSDKKFGPKVGKWVGGMLSKAASGAWDVSMQAGGALLEKALLGYYGLDS
ncbi:hypothetical protein RlegWSM1455_23550 [Rhizobium laguerreae]|uniref:AbiTii domain-containing protein n=1 Tax=Rhizobium laguerreae TaxID=1076926 RepID=UPI001E532D25|nr:hypothetical protein [Rhizobium laguerreae]UFW64426.1 hypothetical protein RlegWSM1455_23550 [Rhizobium laguerreae]